MLGSWITKKQMHLEKPPLVATIFINNFGGRLWTVLFRSTKYCEHISRCRPQTISTDVLQKLIDCRCLSRDIAEIMSHHVAQCPMQQGLEMTWGMRMPTLPSFKLSMPTLSRWTLAWELEHMSRLNVLNTKTSRVHQQCTSSAPALQQCTSILGKKSVLQRVTGLWQAASRGSRLATNSKRLELQKNFGEKRLKSAGNIWKYVKSGYETQFETIPGISLQCTFINHRQVPRAHLSSLPFNLVCHYPLLCQISKRKQMIQTILFFCALRLSWRMSCQEYLVEFSFVLSMLSQRNTEHSEISLFQRHWLRYSVRLRCTANSYYIHTQLPNLAILPCRGQSVSRSLVISITARDQFARQKKTLPFCSIVTNSRKSIGFLANTFGKTTKNATLPPISFAEAKYWVALGLGENMTMEGLVTVWLCLLDSFGFFWILLDSFGFFWILLDMFGPGLVFSPLRFGTQHRYQHWYQMTTLPRVTTVPWELRRS